MNPETLRVAFELLSLVVEFDRRASQSKAVGEADMWREAAKVVRKKLRALDPD